MSVIGQVSPTDESARKKKKIAAIGGSSLLLLAVAATVATVAVTRNNSSSSSSSDSSGGVQTSVKSIQSICQPTDYREQCESTLSKVAGNTTDPKQLIQAAFNVTIVHIKEAFKKSETLKAAAKDPRTSQALHDCGEFFNYAIDELRNSIDRLGALDIIGIDTIIDDLKIWLSAVVTYEETCLDGFENTTGDAARAMRDALQSSVELTSNALAIIDEISDVLTDFKLPFFSRRLLSAEEEVSGGEKTPSWVNPAKRRLLDHSVKPKPDLTVAKDGSGNYKTIGQALEHVPKTRNDTFVIHIKQGVYHEHIIVNKDLTNLMVYGDGPTKTRVTGRLNYIDGTQTCKTATFTVYADNFIAKDMGFENTAGAEKHQAVALRVQSDRSVFYNCHMDAYQDTLYVHAKRQFYRDCTISGTIDFVFGDAASVFQNCKFIVRKPLDNQQTIVTAQGRKDRHESTGIVLHNCTISADPAYAPLTTKLKAYLGRPWKEHSRTIIMQSHIDDLISPDGWLPWDGNFGLKTCYYGEYENRGPGSAMDHRVTWMGIKPVDYNRALRYTVERFIQGNEWLPATGAPYTAGLYPSSQEKRMH